MSMGTPGISYGLDNALSGLLPWMAAVQDLVGGDFTAPKNHIARLNPVDGSAKTPRLIPEQGLMARLPILPGSQAAILLLVVHLLTVNGTAKAGIARLSSVRHLRFSAFGSGLYGGSLQALAVQADDKVLLGGDFSGLNGTYDLPKLLRTSAEGVRDETFTQLTPNSEWRLQSSRRLFPGHYQPAGSAGQDSCGGLVQLHHLQ
jgi:hypothetical protein